MERNKTLLLRALNGTHVSNLSQLMPEHTITYLIPPLNPVQNETLDRVTHFDESVTEYTNEPNTALFCVILIIGTLFIATELRQFRNSKYLGRNVSSLFVSR